MCIKRAAYHLSLQTSDIPPSLLLCSQHAYIDESVDLDLFYVCCNFGAFVQVSASCLNEFAFFATHRLRTAKQNAAALLK